MNISKEEQAANRELLATILESGKYQRGCYYYQHMNALGGYEYCPIGMFTMEKLGKLNFYSDIQRYFYTQTGIPVHTMFYWNDEEKLSLSEIARRVREFKPATQE